MAPPSTSPTVQFNKKKLFEKVRPTLVKFQLRFTLLEGWRDDVPMSGFSPAEVEITMPPPTEALMVASTDLKPLASPILKVLVLNPVL